MPIDYRIERNPYGGAYEVYDPTQPKGSQLVFRGNGRDVCQEWIDCHPINIERNSP